GRIQYNNVGLESSREPERLAPVRCLTDDFVAATFHQPPQLLTGYRVVAGEQNAARQTFAPLKRIDRYFTWSHHRRAHAGSVPALRSQSKRVFTGSKLDDLPDGRHAISRKHVRGTRKLIRELGVRRALVLGAVRGAAMLLSIASIKGVDFFDCRC